MTTPTTIILPALVCQLERFLRPLAATSGDGVQIRQNAHGTTVVACEGRHAATITTRTPGDLEPILVDPAALADPGARGVVKLYRLSATAGAVEKSSGELATVAIAPGELPQSARDLADVVEAEIASGSARAAFEIDPRHLLAVAETLVATGAEKATVVVAPRWNVLAAMAETPEASAMFLVAGESMEASAAPVAPAAAEDPADPLSFTIEDPRARRTAAPGRRKPPPPLPFSDDEIPF